VEHEIIRQAEAVVDRLSARDALSSGDLQALREVLRRARHRAALVDALVERAAREERLAAALEGLIRLAETFRLHSLLAQGPAWDGRPPGVRHAFEVSEGDVLAFLDAVEEARQVLRQVLRQVRGG
jgi:hypothetical protein